MGNIGKKITDLKGKVQYTGVAYCGHDLTSWRNLTKDVLSDNILPKETIEKPKKVIKKADKADELVDQLKTIISHARKEDKKEFKTRQMNSVGKIEVDEKGIITKIESRATYYFGDLT